MEKKTNLSTIFLILALIVIIIMGYFIYKISNEKTLEKQKVEALESTISEVSEKSNDLQESLNKVDSSLNKTVPAETTNAESKEDGKLESKVQLSVNGKYEQKAKTEYEYYDSKVTIFNQTDSSVEFQIDAVHGKDENNVNIGSVRGLAKKTNTENEYVFEEKLDGKTNKIFFDFYKEGANQFLSIGEEYNEGLNPYAGANVYFRGKYEKIKSNDEVKKEIETAFINYIKESMDSKTLTDYRVEKIDILSGNEKKEKVELNSDYQYGDMLAVVRYSVKPKDINKTGWAAGNGEIEGDWIVNKAECVNFKNGELLALGTGW